MKGIMRKEDHNKMLEDNLKKDPRKLGLERIWRFQHNDPKHKSKVVTTEWLNSVESKF